jgi:hypothetical protein
MVVVDVATGNALIEGVDYFYAYPFEEASEKVGVPISGAVALVDVNRVGSFLLNYQTLGGEYVNEESQAIQDGLDALANLNSRTWADIVNVPTGFPPTPHTHRLDNFVGIAEILAKFTSLEAAIRSPERHITMADIVDLNEGYIQPMTEGMASIAATLSTITGHKNIYTAEANTVSTNPVLNNVQNATWTDIGISVTVAFTGTYMVMFSGNPVDELTDTPLDVEFRFLVENTVLSQSTRTGTTVGLTAGNVVKLQLRKSNSTAGNVVIAREGVICGITLLRVSD